MSHPPTTLICTVGTSLFFPNLNFLKPETQYQKEPAENDLMGRADKIALSRYALWADNKKLIEILKQIKDFYDAKNFSQLAGQLVLLPPELRLCGAEINSVEGMIRKKFLSDKRNRLIFLVSETEDGKSIGTILKNYFTHKKCEIRFEESEYLTVSGLQDEKPLIFQREGLPNLVRHLGELFRKWGGSDSIAINATGGYKAQIALAVAFGQAIRCSVFYKHEKFDQIIRFPKIPFTIDLSMVGKHLRFWADMAEPGEIFTSDEMKRLMPDDSDFKEAVYPMLESEGIEGIPHFSLSALGMVYWEAFVSLNPNISLEPSKADQRRGCHFRDDNYPINFKEYVNKVYDSFPKIIGECHSLPYSGNVGIKNRFYVKEKRIIGEYVDRNSFGARFEVMTQAKNTLERKWVTDNLNNWLKNE